MSEWQGRCPRCAFPQAFCLCGEVQPAHSRVAVTVLRHHAELSKTSNTARWAALALPQLRLLDYAATTEPFDVAQLSLDGGCHLLFPAQAPSDGPQSPEAQPTAPPRPARLIALDGTWQQARRMVHRIPGLSSLPRLSLPAPHRDLRRLRKPFLADGMSTLEALAAALALLGEPVPAAALLRVHALALERTVRLRGVRALK